MCQEPQSRVAYLLASAIAVGDSIPCCSKVRDLHRAYPLGHCSVGIYLQLPHIQKHSQQEEAGHFTWAEVTRSFNCYTWMSGKQNQAYMTQNYVATAASGCCLLLPYSAWETLVWSLVFFSGNTNQGSQHYHQPCWTDCVLPCAFQEPGNTASFSHCNGFRGPGSLVYKLLQLWQASKEIFKLSPW